GASGLRNVATSGPEAPLQQEPRRQQDQEGGGQLMGQHTQPVAAPSGRPSLPLPAAKRIRKVTFSDTVSRHQDDEEGTTVAVTQRASRPAAGGTSQAGPTAAELHRSRHPLRSPGPAVQADAMLSRGETEAPDNSPFRLFAPLQRRQQEQQQQQEQEQGQQGLQQQVGRGPDVRQ
ncbi:hypothetical protein Vretifemale_2580, partial [Volvox reticuliferus]